MNPNFIVEGSRESEPLRKVAFYGKGGIGKSTTVSNTSAALADMGYRVMQIGCDPKADSTVNLTGGVQIPTVLSTMVAKNNDVELDDLVFEGSKGVLCVETGGPKPGMGCAGRGVLTAFEQLEKLDAFDEYKPDIVLYDVLGDVVCGGFALPIRNGYADDVCIVTSGEKMALYAARNINQSVENNRSHGYARVKGLILNSRNTPNERETVEKAAEEMGTRVLIQIPRDSIVQEAEDRGLTVVEYAPDSTQAAAYRDLARIVLDGGIRWLRTGCATAPRSMAAGAS